MLHTNKLSLCNTRSNISRDWYCNVKHFLDGFNYTEPLSVLMNTPRLLFLLSLHCRAGLRWFTTCIHEAQPAARFGPLPSKLINAHQCVECVHYSGVRLMMEGVILRDCQCTDRFYQMTVCSDLRSVESTGHLGQIRMRQTKLGQYPGRPSQSSPL